jgi:hypothetical protein
MKELIPCACAQIQIVDTYLSAETSMNTDFAAGTAQFNRTLLIFYIVIAARHSGRLLAGIQKVTAFWMPDQVRHDELIPRSVGITTCNHVQKFNSES